MMPWLKRALHRRSQSKRPTTPRRRFARFTLEALEDRITPSTTLAPPAIVDPGAAVRVDQNSYLIQGTLSSAAKNGLTVFAYRDSNQNGVFDPGVDALVGSGAVAKKGTAFAVPVPLNQDAVNQFFILLSDGKLTSPAVTVPLITEDSTPPTVTGITRLAGPLTSASSLPFQVTFSEPVAGVDPTDFQVVESGSVVNSGLTVSGSGATYTVTVNGVGCTGALGLSLIDDDSIHDILTIPAQDHPLGGTGTGNGSFTTGQSYLVTAAGTNGLATV